MEIWRSLSGTLVIELTTADPAGALRSLDQAGICVSSLETLNEMVLRMRISRRDYPALCRVCHRRSDSVSVLQRSGLYWCLISLLRRPVLVLGLSLLIILTLWLPGRIFFVQVEGNNTVPTRQILEAAAYCGIRFGARARNVRSEAMKNALQEAMPQLGWAGINIQGCTAVISVSERTLIQSEPPDSAVSSIVALRDGVIQQVTVLKGSARCVVGQTVKAGDVLISGFTDCGICLRATCADGEVFAKTDRTVSGVSPTVYQIRAGKVASRKKYSLIIGKKRINFTNSSGILGSTCAKIYEEKYLTLPGGFVLPVALVIETTTSYEIQQTTAEDADARLQAYCRAYLLGQMQAGTIQEAAETVIPDGDCLWLEAGYVCCEMIGTTRIEENLPKYGEDD